MKSVATIRTAEKIPLGPAMAALNERQRTFVVLWNNAGKSGAAECARLAGYNMAGAKQHAHWMLNSPFVQAAIIEDARARLAGKIGWVMEMVEGIAAVPGSQQLPALKWMAGQAGMHEVSRIEHTGEIKMTFEQKLDRIKQLCAERGVDPKQFMLSHGVPAAIVDAEFTEVGAEIPVPSAESW